MHMNHQSNFSQKRKLMIDVCIHYGIRDKNVIKAMDAVPRHEFVPKNIVEHAYEDRALSIGHNQTISQPYVVAKMTEMLKLNGKEKVLEIGTGSGYQAAVLGKLVDKVWSIERIPRLANNAKQTINNLGYKNIDIVVGDGTEGLQQEAPFDRIIVTAGAKEIPEALINQLAEGGIMVIPFGEHGGVQALTLITKNSGKIEIREDIKVMFVPLIFDRN